MSEKTPKADYWKEDPDDLIIVGIDGDGPPWFNQPDRNALPISEDFIASIGIIGVTETCTVVRIGPQKIVDSGRQKTKNCREYNKRLKAALERDDFVPDARTARLLRSGVPQEYEALKERLKCIYKRSTPAELIAADIASNSHKADVSAVQRARNFDAYIEAYQGERSEAIAHCAALAGMSTNAVRQDLELLNLAPELQDSVDVGDVGAATARSAKDAPYAEQKAVADQAKEKRAKTGKKLTKTEAQASLTNPKPRPRGKRDIHALIDHNEDHLDHAFVQGALWAIGELPDDQLGIVPAPAKKRGS